MTSRRASNNPEQVTIRDIKDDIKLVEKVHQEDRVAEAFILLQNIENMIPTLSSNGQDIIHDVLNSSAAISELRIRGEQVMEIMNLFKMEDKWNVWNANLGPHQDVTLYINRDEPEGQYFFKTDGYLRDVGLLEAAAAVLENSLHQHWIPMCTASKTCEVQSAFRRIVQLKMDFVLLKKTATMEVRGDVLPNGSLLLTFHPLREPETSLKYIPKAYKERMDLWGGILLQDIDIVESEVKNELEDLINFVESRHCPPPSPSPRHPAGKQRAFFPETDEDADITNRDDGDAMVDAVNENQSSSSAQSSANEHKDSAQGDRGGYRQGSEDPRPDAVPNNHISLHSHSHESAWSENEKRELGILQRSSKKSQVIKVQAIFRADMKNDFIPDWIFNLGVRSTMSMFVPMLQHQALLFAHGGLNRNLITENHLAIYNQLSARLADYIQGFPSTVDTGKRTK